VDGISRIMIIMITKNKEELKKKNPKKISHKKRKTNSLRNRLKLKQRQLKKKKKKLKKKLHIILLVLNKLSVVKIFSLN